MTRPIVSLLTDFGLRDTYVGQVKAAVLAVAPSAALVDLTHEVPPQDVPAGAFLLWTAVAAFPAEAIHLAVVDPGVGSGRRAIAARARRGDIFVGPDNGLLWPALERLGGLAAAVELNVASYWRSAHPAPTFHGRDIFGPAAGHLAAGVPLDALGTPGPDVHRLAWPTWDGRRGEVLYVDAFGSLITNIPSSALPPEFSVRLGQHQARAAAHYQAAPPGALLAVPGSAGLLEISARDASAAAITGAGRGSSVTVVDG